MKSLIGTLFKGSVIIVWSVGALYIVSLLTLRLVGYDTTIVMSDSMSPLLHTGDVVLLQQRTEYRVGDIIQFRRGDVFYLHRIVAKTKSGYRTQGDANPIPDRQKVVKSDIQGSAIGVLRNLGNPLYQFRQLVGEVSYAGFTSEVSTSSIAHARYWQNPAMSWSIISGTGSITFTAPSGVTFLNSGTRTIQSSITSNSLVKIYLDARMTQKDAVTGGFQISTHTCLNTLSRPICGWVLQFDDVAKALKLFTYQSNGTLSTVLASKSYTTSLTQNRKYVFEISPARILVKLENEVLLDVTSPQVLASSNSALIPSGTRILMYFQGDNRMNANKLVIW
ncbi:MAG: signal peptidase I [Candidatus Nanopelagicales bacterium]